MLVLVLALASFGALFAAGRADRDTEPQAAPPPREVALPAASVTVASLKTTAAIPALRERKVKPKKAPAPAPAAVEPTPAVTPEPTPAPEPTFTPPPAPAPAPTPAPTPPAAARPRPAVRRLGLIR